MKNMNKPLCKITLQDLLDSIQANEKETSKATPSPKTKPEKINDWLSLDEIADDLNINADLLYACMAQWDLQESPTSVSVFNKRIHVRH